MKTGTFICLLCIVVMNSLGYGILIPVIPSFIMELTGEGLADAAIYGGQLMAVYAAMQFLTMPILGNLSDRFGRRPILLISLFAFGGAYVVLGFAQSITWLFCVRVVLGALSSTYSTVTAYIADVAARDEMAGIYGKVAAAASLGLVLGPALGGLLGEFGTRVPFFAAGAVAILTGLVALFLLPESLSVDRRRAFSLANASPLGAFKQLKSQMGLHHLIVSLMLISMAGYAATSLWAYYLIEKFGWSEGLIGGSFAFFTGANIIVQATLTGLLCRKLGHWRVLFLGVLTAVVGNTMFAFAPNGAFIFLCSLVLSLSFAAGPAITSIVVSEVSKTEQGAVQGAIGSAQSLVTVIAPLLMVATFKAFSSEGAVVYLPGAPFLLAALFLCIAAVVLSLKLLQDREKPVATKLAD